MSQLAIDRATLDLETPLRIISGIDEIAQDLWLRLLTFKGELSDDVEKGVPITQEVVRKGTPPARIAAIYRRIILETPGVTRFLAIDDDSDLGPILELDPVDRHLTITFRVDTDEGVLDFSAPISVAPILEAA